MAKPAAQRRRNLTEVALDGTFRAGHDQTVQFSLIRNRPLACWRAPVSDRPEAPRSQAKREQILKGARAAFLAHGFTGASTNAIAAEAGVSKQTLYVYYPSKEALLGGVLERELTALRPDGAPPLPETRGDLRAILTALLRGLIDRLMRPDTIALLRLIVSESARVPELRATFRDAVPVHLLQRVGALLTHAHTRGLIEAQRPDLCARLLVGACMSYVMLDGLLSEAGPRPPDDVDIDHLIELILRAMKGASS
jgi:TetR/AcrR family transcriptional regulator, mexJK operon transcriptional repressor